MLFYIIVIKPIRFENSDQKLNINQSMLNIANISPI
jgi:hypothetical protein